MKFYNPHVQSKLVFSQLSVNLFKMLNYFPVITNWKTKTAYKQLSLSNTKKQLIHINKPQQSKFIQNNVFFRIKMCIKEIKFTCRWNLCITCITQPHKLYIKISLTI